MEVLHVEFLRNTLSKAAHRYTDMECGGNGHMQREQFRIGRRYL